MKRSEPITAAEYSYTVLFQPEPEGGFTVTCPSLPGLVSYGTTLDEARTMESRALAATLANTGNFKIIGEVADRAELKHAIERGVAHAREELRVAAHLVERLGIERTALHDLHRIRLAALGGLEGAAPRALGERLLDRVLADGLGQ